MASYDPDPAPAWRRRRLAVLAAVLLVLAGWPVVLRIYVLYRRDPQRWGEKSMTYGRWCIQNYRAMSMALDMYCTETGGRACPESLEAYLLQGNSGESMRELFICPLARHHGKVGRFVYAGAGKEWHPKFSRNWYARYEGQEPIIFDYPDNHPEGGYALMSDGDIVQFDAAGWRKFLDKHLPPDYPLKENDLRWWQWRPSE